MMIGTVEVVKRHKRLHLQIRETGECIYTPPDFVRVNSRLPLWYLAQAMTARGRRDIALIMAFEDRWTLRKRRYGPRPPGA